MPISPDSANGTASAIPGLGRDPASVRRRIEAMEAELERAEQKREIEDAQAAVARAMTRA